MSFHVKDSANSINVLLCLTIFIVLESNLILQRSCLFKSKLLKWNQRDVCFWKNFLLKFKLLWSKTQHTIQCSPLIVLYLEKQKWPVVRFKMTFSWFFVSTLNSDFGYIFWWSVMRWHFYRFQKQDAQLYQERLFLFLAFILSTCIMTSSLIHEVTTLMEKLFKFWERHLSVQIAYLIKKGF